MTADPPHTTVHPLLLAAGVSTAALIVYGLTLSHTINAFDSAAFVAGAYTLGIVHATGYPLYLLLGNLAAHLPFGSPALNVNALSAVYAALAAGAVTLLAYRLAGRAHYAAFCGLLFAFAGTVWSVAVLAEVYTLTALLLGGLLLATLTWLDTGGRAALISACLLAGLNLTNHLGSVFFVAGLAAIVALRLVTRKMRLRTGLLALLCAALPLSLYLYLPLRFLADPPLNYVGQYFDVSLATPGGVLWMISGRMFSSMMFGRTPLEALVSLWEGLRLLSLDLLGIGVVLVAIGLPVLLHERRGFALFTVAGAAATLGFFSFYDVTDSQTMIGPALVGLMPLVAVGLRRAGEFIQGDHSACLPAQTSIEIGLGLLIIGAGLALSWRYIDRSRDDLAERFAREVLANVEPDALILTFWATDTPLRYLHIVERARPDVTLLDRGWVVLGLRDRLLRQGIRDERVAGVQAALRLIEQVDGELDTRPIYVTSNDGSLNRRFCLVAMGGEAGLYRVRRAPLPGEICAAPPSDREEAVR
ncbi:MAG: DUF2723 domain-containing protein [Anaerolineae bacterium]|nr:DUF2723 domain-containing protein [Anaerolineae bacterium]